MVARLDPQREIGATDAEAPDAWRGRPARARWTAARQILLRKMKVSAAAPSTQDKGQRGSPFHATTAYILVVV